jgi:Zn-dependent M16 (insulinase) family peptidase
VNEKGEDAGVVFSEMQAIENRGSTLVERALSQTIYPAPSGYRYVF